MRREHKPELLVKNTTPLKSLQDESKRLKSVLSKYRSMLYRYRTLTESSQAGIYVVQKGRIQYVNPSLAKMLGYRRKELIGRDFWDFVHPKDQPILRHQVLRQKGVPDPLQVTFKLVKRDGSDAWADARGMIVDYMGRHAHIGTVVDMTEQKKAEEELKRERKNLEKRVQERTKELVRTNERLKREVEERKLAERAAQSEKKFSDSVINSLPGIFYLFDESLRMVSWNRNLENITQRTSEEILNMNALDFFKDVDQVWIGKKIQETLNSPVEETLAAKHGIEVVGVDEKTGIGKTYLLTGVRLELEGRVYQIGVGVDITERKKTEQAILESKQELRELSAKLITAQEKERQYLAMELHDGIGQALSAINFSLQRMMKRFERDEDSNNQRSLEKVLQMVKNTIEEVRRMSRNLRPSMLDDLGILTTLTWFCRNFGQVYPNITVSKHIVLEESDVPESLKIVIFRILQEAMNNIAKHSRARKVDILLDRKDGMLEFKIKDDGQGFDHKKLAKADSTQRGFGIAGMKDRIELTGGMFKLRAAPGRGTVISARWTPENLLIN